MMKKEITLGQILAVAVTLLIAIVGGWVTLNNKVSGHEKQIQAMEARQLRIESMVDRIENKIDRIYENQILSRNDNR